MSKLLKEFTRALRNGTGKAFLILQEHPELPVDGLLVDAALHNYGYDPQSTNSRAFQLTELLRLRPGRRELILLIAERFAAEFNFETQVRADIRHEDTRQVYELLARNRVTPRVGEIIHRRFAIRHHMEWEVGAEAILETEGAGGLLFIAETVGAFLAAYPEEDFDDNYLFWAKEIFDGVCDWRTLLADRAKRDDRVRVFWTALGECERREAPTPHSPPGFAQVESALEREAWSFFDHLELTKAEQAKLRRMFRTEANPMKVSIICRVLRQTGGVTRSMIPRLLEFARREGRPSGDAIDALSTLKSGKLRAIAVAEMKTVKPGDWKYFDLLAKNWRPEDEKLFLKHFNRLRSPHLRDSLVFPIWSFENVSASLLKLLLERSSCGSCRGYLAEKLAAEGMLDDELRREFLHDAVDKIRAIGGRL